MSNRPTDLGMGRNPAPTVTITKGPVDQIEAEIQAKGLTAPRVTPQRIEEVIASEYYFSAANGAHEAPSEFAVNGRADDLDGPLRLLTICVLVLQNGFTILGKSACASPENFDAELGRIIARKDAVSQIWALEGYALKNRLQADKEFGQPHHGHE